MCSCKVHGGPDAASCTYITLEKKIITNETHAISREQEKIYPYTKRRLDVCEQKLSCRGINEDIVIVGGLAWCYKDALLSHEWIFVPSGILAPPDIDKVPESKCFD